MGTFSKAIIRAGFSTVFRPTSVLPTSRDQLQKHSPVETELTSGTGASAVDLEYIAQRTLGASANEDLDFAGSLTDAFGSTITMVKIKGIYVFAASANTNSVIIKPAAANGFTGPFGAATHTLTIPPGGRLLLAAPVSGWTVTAGTGDKMNFANSAAGSSVTYDLHVIGTSA